MLEANLKESLKISSKAHFETKRTGNLGNKQHYSPEYNFFVTSLIAT